jgi:hypothetical protein
LSEIGNIYQPSADGRKTIRELRAAIRPALLEPETRFRRT